MPDLIHIYKKNRKRRPLFSVSIMFDWYDSPLSGIAKLSESEELYFFETVWFHFDTGLKIYALMEASPVWMEKITRLASVPNSKLFHEEVEHFLSQESRDKFLLRAKHIDDFEYDLVQASSVNFLPYKSVENLANDSEQERRKWLSFFNH